MMLSQFDFRFNFLKQRNLSSDTHLHARGSSFHRSSVNPIMHRILRGIRIHGSITDRTQWLLKRAMSSLHAVRLLAYVVDPLITSTAHEPRHRNELWLFRTKDPGVYAYSNECENHHYQLVQKPAIMMPH